MVVKSKYLKTLGLGPPFVQIVDIINQGYEKKLYLCVDILSRKLLELMITDILVNNPGPDAIWKDSHMNQRYPLYHTLTTFWELVLSRYRPFIPQYDKFALQMLKDTSWDIKKLGDRGAHSFVSSSSEKEIDERQTALQDLLDFLWYVKGQIPKSVISWPPSREEKQEIFTYNVTKPEVFPSRFELLRLREYWYDFEIPFEITALTEDIDCTIHVESKSQSLGFVLDYPVDISRWGGLRKTQIRISLSHKISERIRISETRRFVFHGFVRILDLNEHQKSLTIWYKIKCKGAKSGIEKESGERRIVVPLGIKAFIDRLEKKVEKQTKTANLEDIPGIGPTRARRLRDSGIDSVKDFILSKPEQLQKILGLKLETIEEMIKVYEKLIALEI